MDRLAVLGLLAALSFVPAVAFMAWARARERHGREPFGAVLGAFVHGGTFGVAMAIVLSVFVGDALVGASGLVVAVVVAPLVEEATKGLGLLWVRRQVDELEDGLVYGLAIGLGFAATETFLYGLLRLSESSLAGAVFVVAARNASSLLLHAASSAVVGFGYARVQVGAGSRAGLLVAYLCAAGLHAVYNTLVLTAGWTGFLAAVVLVVAVVGVLLGQLRRLDQGAPAPL